MKLRPNLNKIKNKGKLILNKGRNEGLSVYTFDGLKECTKEECPIYDTCPYDKKGICKIRSHYLDHVLKTLNTIPDKMDKLASLKIGFSIIPLYNQLINLKIEAYNAPVMFAGKVHPLYREIRECIRTISLLLKDLTPEEVSISSAGDQSYYDSLFTVEKKKDKVLKRKFLKKNPRNKSRNYNE